MTTNAQIKKWLKNIGKDREWLAEQCCVSLSSINSWLADSDRTHPIPAAKLRLIESLMQNTGTGTTQPPPTDQWRAVALMLTQADFADLEQIAAGAPLDKTIRALLLEKMREVLKKQQ